MKIVLRHKTTGHYYRAPGKWVRRADNALAFDAVDSAHQYLRAHHIQQTQAVLRLAPYLMPLLSGTEAGMWERWLQARGGDWYGEQAGKFERN